MLLDFEKTKSLLKEYNLPLSESKSVSSFDETLEFIENFPVVLKVISSEILHRTEKDLVKTDIENKEELKKNYEYLEKKADKLESSKIVIQEQEEGLELVYGMKKDETFGPVLMFGLGGIFVEVLEDVSFGITPVGKKEAEEMIRRIKAFKVLKGFRNYPSVNLDKAAELLVNLSDLVENEELQGVDFNPVFAKGSSFKIADPKIIL
ncbi:MAG: acetate--CoA ligase family protein [Candidatus Paceibacterota bacterium]